MKKLKAGMTHDSAIQKMAAEIDTLETELNTVKKALHIIRRAACKCHRTGDGHEYGCPEPELTGLLGYP